MHGVDCYTLSVTIHEYKICFSLQRSVENKEIQHKLDENLFHDHCQYQSG